MFSVFIARVWAKVWPYIAAAAGIIAGLFFVRQSGKVAGRDEVRRELERDNQQAREVRDDVAAEIDALDDDAVRARARERMRKSAGR